ncbi:MAG: thiamine pyrophosphate-dependent enzyme, partial [Acidobacteria bacterium]|nr:thiamine pyrophosphate-dependent enzyme [Acidobacteriota bacterium]
AQHDPAEYVPQEMVEYWKARDPIARYEEYLTANKLWNEKVKAGILARIEKEILEDQEFAENSPFPPPEFAEEGVYCEGPLPNEAVWKRPIEEVMPPKASVKPAWKVSDFGGLEHPTPNAAPASVSGDGTGAAARKAAKKTTAAKSLRAKATGLKGRK